MILTSENFSPLQIWISPRNQVQIRLFLIRWILFEVIFLNPLFSLISHLNSSSNLTKFQKISQKYLDSLWIRPLFTIIPFNSLLIPQIGKFGLIFDAIPHEIDDLAVSSPQGIFLVFLDSGTNYRRKEWRHTQRCHDPMI